MGWPAWAGLALVLGLPSVVQAQMPLFPNLTTRKRQRVSCLQEAPEYRLYRQQYYGYYPTCWRMFPPGWGCPSPEVVNPDPVMRELERNLPTIQPFGSQGREGETNPPTDDQNPNVPALPDSERQRMPERDLTPPVEGAPLDNPPAAGAEAPASDAAVRRRPRSPGSISLATTDHLEPIEPPSAPPALESEPSADAASAPPVPAATAPTATPPLGAAPSTPVLLPTTASSAPPPPGTMPQQRRTLLGSFFDSLRGRQRR
jgi:hypothetical protein